MPGPAFSRRRLIGSPLLSSPHHARAWARVCMTHTPPRLLTTLHLLNSAIPLPSSHQQHRLSNCTCRAVPTISDPDYSSSSRPPWSQHLQLEHARHTRHASFKLQSPADFGPPHPWSAPDPRITASDDCTCGSVRRPTLRRREGNSRKLSSTSLHCRDVKSGHRLRFLFPSANRLRHIASLSSPLT